MKPITKDDIMLILTGSKKDPECPHCHSKDVQLNLINGDWTCKSCKGVFSNKQTDKVFEASDVLSDMMKLNQD